MSNQPMHLNCMEDGVYRIRCSTKYNTLRFQKQLKDLERFVNAMYRKLEPFVEVSGYVSIPSGLK